MNDFTLQLHSHHAQVQYAVFPNIGFKHLLPKLTERLQQFYPIASKIPVVPFLNKVPSQTTQIITQSWFWPTLGNFFRPGDVIVTETGALIRIHCSETKLILESGTSNFGIIDVPLPPKTNLISQVLWGSIGWSVGAALGAALAGRDLNLPRTILFVGDGSL